MSGKSERYWRTKLQDGQTTKEEPSGSYDIRQTLGVARQLPKIRRQVRG
jgi:hypothetical protein